MQYMLHGADVVGYTFNADTYCADDIAKMFRCEVPAVGVNASAETVLDAVAGKRGIDRRDERTFDSGDFPKVIFASMVESDDDRCGACHAPLIGD
ncbi:hypothetical protein [Micromonospora chalcea]|uniref:hypothetical protein n=1 Tax=Micromonospora chalcea TaxID=1874 RepID=UPI003D731D5E